MYQHHNWQGALLDYPVSKVVCVGSNYAKHIKEMGSAVPEEPVLFIKPETALCDLRQPLAIPSDFGSVHHEVELAGLFCAKLRQAKGENGRQALAGYGGGHGLPLAVFWGKKKKPGHRGERKKGFKNFLPFWG
ncbi:fumarylacetoacetate hydrolase family protein, partial [Escherichia coli]|nr:fumarylacetoacetate hydrolase family protein [Escherichia coli]